MSNIYRTVMRVNKIERPSVDRSYKKAHIIIAAIDPHNAIVVNYDDLLKATGFASIASYDRFIILIDIGQDVEDVRHFTIADTNILVGVIPQ